MENVNLEAKFKEIFGEGDSISTFFAPGRINLIGEHIDYNGGNVFPCALDFGTWALARKREDNKVKFASLNLPLTVTVDLDDIKYDKEHDWANYPKGVIDQFLKKGFELGGFEVLYYGTIPNGAGLSSSASIEMVTSVLLKDFFNCDIDQIEMVKLSQKVENDFIGVNSGIMDQFAVGMGKKDMAIYLNCDTLEYEYVPVNLKGMKIVIGNTNKRRGLADSKYNERRRECDMAIAALRTRLDIDYLADLTKEEWEEHKHLITDETVRKRAEHAVYENERVKEAVIKLNQGDIEAFGKILNEGHKSLRDLYEVTGFELDTMIEEAWKVDGVIGARMTGAGFGGCTIAIVKDEAVENFKKQVGENYEKKTGLKADFYIANIGDGARKIN